MNDESDPVEVAEAIHALARQRRPALVVEWRDGATTWYPLRHAIGFEDNDTRRLVVKVKELDAEERETGAQDYRVVIPYEVVRKWHVYPRLDEVRQEVIEQEVMHEALPDGRTRCGYTGSRWSTEDLFNVTCRACLEATPRLPSR